MKVRTIDVNGDWTFGKGVNNYKTDNAAIAQNIRTRLNSFLGDCFFAIDEGIDWWNLLGTKNQLAINLAISATILKTEGVTGLVQLLTNLDTNRKLTLSYEVNTVFSDANLTPTIVSQTGYLVDSFGNILVAEDGNRLILG